MIAPAPVALPGLALTAGLALFGPELLIVVALLAATGFVPFLDPTHTILPNIKGYFFFFLIAVGTMTITWVARVHAGRPLWRMKPTLLMAAVLTYGAYVLLMLVATNPMAEPTLLATFVEFPVMAVATYLWLSHDDALEGVKRLLPLVIVVVAAWSLAYVLGSAGCGPCGDYVSADLFRKGLLGPTSRLYTPAQYSLLALVLVAFGQTLRRPTPLTISLTVLGLTTVALQSFRMQYLGIAAGMLVLIIWRLSQSRAGGRLLVGSLAVAAFIALLLSPVGDRALSAYDELSTGTGTGGYRVQLYEEVSQNWSLFGTGITSKTVDLGFNQDIGVSSTFLVVGFVGGALQLTVLALGLLRGIRARSLAGATLASIFLMVLVTRGSLPLMELGHSPITYGVAVGFAAWLSVSSRSGFIDADRARS
jgi:hypothetical protein